MTGEYDHINPSLDVAADYIELTGGMAPGDGTTDLDRDIKGVNVSEAGTLKITTATGTVITVWVDQGDNGLPITRRLWTTGTATLLAGII